MTDVRRHNPDVVVSVWNGIFLKELRLYHVLEARTIQKDAGVALFCCTGSWGWQISITCLMLILDRSRIGMSRCRVEAFHTPSAGSTGLVPPICACGFLRTVVVP